jgi:hypothetical protein
MNDLDSPLESFLDATDALAIEVKDLGDLPASFAWHVADVLRALTLVVKNLLQQIEARRVDQARDIQCRSPGRPATGSVPRRDSLLTDRCRRHDRCLSRQRDSSPDVR